MAEALVWRCMLLPRCGLPRASQSNFYVGAVGDRFDVRRRSAALARGKQLSEHPRPSITAESRENKSLSSCG